MSKLSSTYAGALFDLATEQGNTDLILSQCEMLRDILSDNSDYLKLLDTPTVSKDEKIKTVDRIFRDSLDRNLLNYIKVMIARGNSRELLASLKDYEDLYNKANNIEKAVAVTAVPMTEQAIARLTEKLEKMTGKKIILTNKVDEKCLGGVILEFSTMQLDDSIASKLEELRDRLRHAE